MWKISIYLSIGIILSALTGIMACSEQERSSEFTPAVVANSEPNLSEGILYARADTAELKLNIAVPANPKPRYKLLIFIHGGGWQTGHRNAYNSQVLEAARRGFVAATISHRYTRTVDESGVPIYRWPLPLQDVQAAIRFLRLHADEFHIDTDRIGILGASSGAHLAMMAGFIDELMDADTAPVVPGDEQGSIPVNVHAVANISGPVDLVSAYEAPVVTPFLDDLMNGNPETLPELYQQASPIYHISQNSPPLLTIHGKQDDVVPIEQAHLIERKMQAQGLYHKLKIFKNQGHIFKGETATESWNIIYDFFGENL